MEPSFTEDEERLVSRALSYHCLNRVEPTGISGCTHLTLIYLYNNIFKIPWVKAFKTKADNKEHERIKYRREKKNQLYFISIQFKFKHS